MGRVYKKNKRNLISEKIFKAYDIRGKYPVEINEAVVTVLSRAIGHSSPAGVFVLARDGRLSSPRLYGAALKVLVRIPKLKIVKVGLATTPMLYFLVNKLKARGGMIVTASHNPKEYNGLKVVGRNAEMISGFKVLKML